MNRTIGDLARDEQAPAPATRSALRAKFDKLETAFALLFDGLAAVGEMLLDMRELLDESVDDEAHDSDDGEHDEVAVANEKSPDGDDVEASPS